MSDKCAEHTKLMMDIVEIKTDLKYLCKEQKETNDTVRDHVGSSDRFRDDVKRHNLFEGGTKKAMWILFASAIGTWVKVVFFR